MRRSIEDERNRQQQQWQVKSENIEEAKEIETKNIELECTPSNGH
jgi:hypothetical protein